MRTEPFELTSAVTLCVEDTDVEVAIRKLLKAAKTQYPAGVFANLAAECYFDNDGELVWQAILTLDGANDD